MPRKNSVGLAILLAGLGVRRVDAQTAVDAAQRSKLMQQAQEARDEGDHPKALALAARAGEILMKPGLRLFIAEEMTAVDKLADSYLNARLCAKEAEQDKALKHRDTILAACNKLAGILKRNSALLTISTPTPVPAGVRVTVGGQVVSEAFFGNPFLVSPGTVSVDANAPGHAAFHREFKLKRGDELAVTVQLTRMLEPVPEPAVAAVEPQTPVQVEVAIAPEKSLLRRVGPFAVVGVGAAGLLTSAIFLGLRNDAIRKLEAQCNGTNHDYCPDTPDVRSFRRTASTDNTITNVSLVVGIAAVTAGAAWLMFENNWLFFEKKGSATEGSARLQVLPSREGVFVTVGGAW